MNRIENVLCNVKGEQWIGTITELEDGWCTFHVHKWTYPPSMFTPLLIIKNIKYKNNESNNNN